jgi:hypothetical protein
VSCNLAEGSMVGWTERALAAMLHPNERAGVSLRAA